MFMLVLEVIKKMLSIWFLSVGSVVVFIILVLGIYSFFNLLDLLWYNVIVVNRPTNRKEN